MTLNYDYTQSKQFCDQIGLIWLGDDYQGLVDDDNSAKKMGLSQDQVDALMRLHLWQVKTFFTPKNYKFTQRIMFAIYFLTGWKPS